MNDQPFPPQDNDPLGKQIMEAWVRRIVMEIAQEMADRIVEEVGRIFLATKTANHARGQRMLDLENAIADLKKTRTAKAKGTKP
jgi:hypothetical protein